MNQETTMSNESANAANPLSGLDEASTSTTQIATPNKTAGEVLREIRESEGMSRETLAAALKVSLKKIEAMEDNRFQDLPDMVFARGLAGSMCRYLKADPERVLMLMPAEKESATESIVRPSMQAEFHDPNDASPKTNWLKLSWKAMLLVAVLLLAAVIVMFIPTLKDMAQSSKPEIADATMSSQDNLKPTGDANATAPVSAAVPVEPTPAAAPVVAAPAPAPAPVAAPTPAPVAPAPAAATPANTPPVTASALPETSTVAPVAAANAAATDAAAAPAADGSDTITFKANKEAWITVRDSHGDDVFRQLVGEGQSASVKAAPPLRVTVGNSDSVEVLVKGQPFDITQYSKGRVARFEVK